jgi:hypothetical protein
MAQSTPRKEFSFDWKHWSGGMEIVVLGGDGYLGWPSALHLPALGYDVVERLKARVDPAAIMPNVRWTETASELPRTGRVLAQT